VTWRILDHPEALEDYAEQAEYLEAQSDGFGDRFIDRAEQSLNDILADPEGWVRVPYWTEEPTLYWRSITPFRVHVIYYREGETVRIIAYAHESREPGYWRRRLDRRLE
jgi:plasmid stabilization system protein ParE